ncbi:hypothetical protein [Conexivisphaera calida]|uniref:Uncharacterized protein n=1 Tax=Conexivisphaera calida TaxID=1874277 RepID=A0A4P2VF61_9ARCH|nr:hypothetical protein [Conexivisphaera calida]BBE42113.1 hypothetical protein NAS2_0724 [Conexivisphaera calida]
MRLDEKREEGRSANAIKDAMGWMDVKKAAGKRDVPMYTVYR